MTVPAAPFKMSQAFAEAGLSLPRAASALTGLVGHGLPYNGSELAGKSSLAISSINTGSGANTNTKIMTATIVGGTGQLSYAWSADGDIFTRPPTNASSCTVTGHDATQGTANFGNVYLTVTDASGHSASASKAVTTIGNTQCVAWDSFMHDDALAADVRAGDMILVLTPDLRGVELAAVTANVFGTQPGVRLRSTSGVELDCSIDTPIVGPDGGQVRAVDSLGHAVAVDAGFGLTWERIAAVEALGPIAVAQISVSDKVYAAGRERGRMMFTHNIKAAN